MTLIPEGTYEAQAVEVDGSHVRILKTKAGNAQAAAAFKILNAPEDSDQRYPLRWTSGFSDTLIGPEGKKRTVTKMTFESLRAMGFQGDNLEELLTQKLDRKVSVTVRHETYEDKMYAKIGFVNSLNGSSFGNAMSRSELSTFAARMRAQLSAPPSRSEMRDDNPPPPNDADIPF